MFFGWFARWYEALRVNRRMQEIRERLETKSFTEAIELLESFLLTFPKHREAYHQYVLACHKTNTPLRAERFLQEIAVNCEGNNPNPRNYLAAAYYFQGKITEAKDLWEQIIRDHPQFAPAFSNLGAIYLHLGKLEQALLQFKVAIQLEPHSSMSAYNNIGEIYMAKGDYAQAMQYLKEAETMPGELETIYANLGHCSLALGEDEVAIDYYERCLSSQESFTVNESKSEVYLNLVRLYLEHRQYQAALDRCLEGINDIPQNAALWSQLGQIYLAQKEYTSAVKAFRKSLSLGPMSPRNLQVHRRLALAYFHLGKFGKSTAEYRRAMAWHPDLPRNIFETDCHTVEERLHRCKEQLNTEVSSEVYQQIGDAYFALGDLEEAISSYEAAVKLNPNDIASYIGLGTAYYSMDQPIHAIRYFSRALEVNPLSVEGHLGWGLTYLSQGSATLAMIKFKWAASLDPTNATAANYLGRAYMINGDTDQAESSFRKALELSPTYAQARYNLGQLLSVNGRYEEAIDQFNLALEVFPDYVPALCNLGQAYQHLGRSEDAIIAWREALKINPNNPIAERFLEELNGRETAATAEVSR